VRARQLAATVRKIAAPGGVMPAPAKSSRPDKGSKAASSFCPPTTTAPPSLRQAKRSPLNAMSNARAPFSGSRINAYQVHRDRQP